MRSWQDLAVSTWGLHLSSEQVSRCEAYLDLLARWNRAYNLTAIRDRHRMVTHHLLDSLSVSAYLYGYRFIDVGTGPGLPGIPLAIVHPDKEFVLLDSNGKKTRFLDQVCADLGISNVRVIQQRAEQLLDKRGFDMVLSRAFASLAAMLSYTDHLLCPDGQWLAMKGVYPAEEIDHLPPGVVMQAAHSVAVPGMDAERHLVVMRRAINEQGFQS